MSLFLNVFMYKIREFIKIGCGLFEKQILNYYRNSWKTPGRFTYIKTSKTCQLNAIN